jgi:hypothetical protein
MDMQQILNSFTRISSRFEYRKAAQMRPSYQRPSLRRRLLPCSPVCSQAPQRCPADNFGRVRFLSSHLLTLPATGTTQPATNPSWSPG